MTHRQTIRGEEDCAVHPVKLCSRRCCLPQQKSLPWHLTRNGWVYRGRSGWKPQCPTMSSTEIQVGARAETVERRRRAGERPSCDFVGFSGAQLQKEPLALPSCTAT